MTRRAALLAALLALLTVLVPGSVATASPASDGDDPRSDHVVVVGLAGLRWTDVSTDRTPALAALVGRGSVASLSVRSAAVATCPAEGWLTLGSGTYAADETTDGDQPPRDCTRKGLPAVRADGRSGTVENMAGLRRANHRLRFGAQPGLLGNEVRCAAAVGPGAALAAADEKGRVSDYAAELPDDPAALLEVCPVAVVDLGSLPVGTDERNAALEVADRDLARIVAAKPAGTALIVVGVAGASNDPRLHLAAVDAPDFDGGFLTSPSTRRVPYVQLVDVAPTALSLLGEPVPDAAAGQPWRAGGDGRPASLAGTKRALADTDVAAVQQRAVLPGFFVGYGILLLLVVIGVTVVLVRRRAAPAWLGVAALAMATVPGSSFLANLVPWWRAGWPLAALGLAAAVAGALTTALAYLVRRHSLPGRVAVICAVTVGMFSLDAVTGSHLQINSMLGYNPLVAGRFIGIGNIAFALYGAAAVMLAAVLAAGKDRRTALAIVAAVGVPVLLLDGLPAFGADFGGVLSLVPTFGLLALVLIRSRLTLARIVTVCVAGVALVAAISVLDYLRPPNARSHFGRFAGAVLDGGGASTVQRKLLTSLDLLLTGPLQIVALLITVLAAVLVLRPRGRLREAYEDAPWLRPALLGVLLLSAFGFATNDSGVAIPVVAGALALPLTLAALVRTGEPEPDGRPAGSEAPQADTANVLP